MNTLTTYDSLSLAEKMRGIFSSPTISRSLLGGDHLFSKFFELAEKSHAVNYPPYNVVKHNDNKYSLEMAVAGFGKSDLDIEIDGDKLIITGKLSSEDNPAEYAFKGIAERTFKREFTLADNIEIKGASLYNGLLRIVLESLIPEKQKTKKVEIKETKPTK